MIKFFADPKEFLIFLEVFDATVHGDKSKSDLQNFTSLKGLPTDDAPVKMKSLPFADRKHEEALRLLMKRCGRKQVITSSNVEAMIKLPTIISVKYTR